MDNNKSPKVEPPNTFHHLDESLKRIPFLPQLESRFKVSKVYIFLLSLVVAAVLSLVILGPSACCNSIAFLYPGYMSFKAMQNDNLDEHIHWLTYFVIYGLFNVTESVADVLLFWLPYYKTLKLVFLLWCFLPQTKGCKVVYERLVRPFFSAHQSKIDSSLETIEGSFVQATQEIRGVSSEFFQQMATNMVTSFTKAALSTAPAPSSSSTSGDTASTSTASSTPSDTKPK